MFLKNYPKCYAVLKGGSTVMEVLKIRSVKWNSKNILFYYYYYYISFLKKIGHENSDVKWTTR